MFEDHIAHEDDSKLLQMDLDSVCEWEAEIQTFKMCTYEALQEASTGD